MHFNYKCKTLLSKFNLLSIRKLHGVRPHIKTECEKSEFEKTFGVTDFLFFDHVKFYSPLGVFFHMVF